MTALSRVVISALALTAATSVVMARTAPQPKPVWLILVDDFHLQFKSTGYLRRLMQGIVREVIEEGDEFTVTLSGGKTSLPWTSAQDRVDSFARDVSGMGLRPTDRVTPAEVEFRERVMLEASLRLLDSVAEDKERRPRMIVISNGWRSGPDALPVQTVITRAKSVGVPIVTIDPEQLVRNKEPIAPADPTAAALLATTAASLRAAAERTGGLAILDSRELTEVLGLVRKAFKLPGNPA
jgi:hypothetical protein